MNNYNFFSYAKYIQFISVSIEIKNIPNWLRSILDENQNKYF